jgi:cobalt-zinc-cadmium efflux system outer membrane protein
VADIQFLKGRGGIELMRIIKYFHKALFHCFPFVLIATLLSAVVPAKGEEISLEEALQLFYKNNYDILINRYEIDKAYGDFVGARLLPNPNATYSATGLDISTGKTDDTIQYLQLDQLILLGGKRELRTNSALAVHQAAILTHKDVIRTLIIGFYAAYYNLQLDRLGIEFGRYDLGRFDKILEIAQRRFDAGFLSLIDYTKIKLARIELENNLTNFEKQFRADLETFNFLLGSGNQLEPRKLVIQETFPEYSENILVEVALQNRYDLLSLQKQSEAAKYSMSLARAMRIPDITVGGQYALYGTDNRSRVGAVVGLPIPVFNRNQGEILRRNAEYKQLEEQIKRVQRLIVSDIRQSLNTYRSSLKIFDAYRMRKREMDDLLNRSESAFSLGGITVLDLLDTRKTYRDFVAKYNQALVQALLNQELIKVYTGELR